MEIEATRRLFNVEEYHRMAEVGVLAPDDRVELIEGEVLRMSPMGRLHAACLMRINRILTLAFSGRLVVAPQLPLRLDDYSEPEPDLMLLAWRDDFYASSAPRARDTVLVVEISDTTLDFDRGVKLPRYAASGVCEVWILDLDSNLLRTYGAPSGGSYAVTRALTSGARVSIAAFPELEFEVDDLLPE